MPKSEKPVKRASKSEARVEAASLMLQRLTSGHTVKDLAATHGISERTVRRRLADANGDAVLDAMRAVLVQDMLPRSLAVLQEALEGEDLKLAVTVALRIVDSLGMKAVAAAPPTGAPNGADDTLELFRERLTLTRRQPSAETPGAEGSDGEAVEGLSVRPPSLDGPIIDVTPAASDSPHPGLPSDEGRLGEDA